MKFFNAFWMRSFLLLSTMLLSMLTFAQPDPMCDPADPVCPIDDYFGVLIGAIILIAAFRAYKRKKALITCS